MFGLPTHRTKTPLGERSCVDDGITSPSDPKYDPTKDASAYGCCPTCPKLIKSALRLAEMRWNHYTVVISQDLKNMRTWGSTCSPAFGVPGPSADPQRVFPNWVGPKEEIAYIRTQQSWSLFRTLQGSIYAAGNTNPGGIFNNTWTNTGRFERVISDVKWISIAGYSGGGETTSVYVKNNGRVHGLGAGRASGFGGYTTALTTDGVSTNDLGIGDAIKCWVQMDGNNVNNTKTFVLKTDGTLWACGNNGSGALGVGDPAVHITTWKQVIDSAGNPLQKVQEVISSSITDTTCFLANGRVYCCGINTNGGLGLGLSAGTTKNTATLIPNISNANRLGGAYFYSSFLASTLTNEVYTWGANANGECGLGVTGKVNTATKVTSIPTDEKVTFIHGGGNYGVIDGAFVVVREKGSVYVAGMNVSFALGYPNLNGQDILTFVRNDYFGFGSPKLTEPWRFPITIANNNFTTGSLILSGNGPIDYVDKNVTPIGLPTRLERVYVNPGYYVSGPGIQHGTMVTYVDRVNHRIHIDTPALAAGTNIGLTYVYYPKAVQADLCGYQGSQRELSMKVVTQDGTLYQCGWNQLVSGIYNFNPRVGSEKVDIPTAFEANF